MPDHQSDDVWLIAEPECLTLMRFRITKSDPMQFGAAYGTDHFLSWLVKEGIAPYVVVRDQSKRKDGTFAKADFHYDRERDLYVRPTGKELKKYRQKARLAKAKPPKDGTHKYRVKKAD